ncbi:MAG: DUF721 domain-containing protein [Gallionella sp.]|nr:DUF721 domain-containing protein [Gallionella sp.]
MSDNPQLRSLFNTANALAALQEQFAHVAPPYFAQSSQVLGLQNGTLIIAVSNGTLAAKLRQLAPQVVEKLQNKGCEVSAIRVKVQVNYAAIPPKHTERILTRTAQHQLLELSRNLTDSPLKLALEKFSKKTRQG